MIALCVCALAGCEEASISYYYAPDSFDDGRRFEVKLPDSLITEIETGAPWTVESYLTAIAGYANMDISVEREGGVTFFSLFGPLPPADGSADGTVNYRVENRFFTRRVYITEDNPFNGMREEYDTCNAAEGSIMRLITSGVSDGETTIPALRDAFPAIREMDPNALTLRFLWNESRSSRYKPLGEDEEFAYGRRWQVWNGKFDNEYRSVEYYYSVPNPVGFYVVVLVLGAAVVAIVLIATRKSARKPALVDPNAPRTRGAANTVRDDYVRAAAQKELDDIFEGNFDDETERLKRRIREVLPPDEAEEAIKKLQERDKR